MCSLISFDSQTEITNLLLLHKTLLRYFDQIMFLMDSFWFWVSQRWHAFKRSGDDSCENISWSSLQNTNGKHLDRSYIYLCWTFYLWAIRMLAFNTFFWWDHDHVMIYGPNSCNRRDLITFFLLWIAYPLLFAYSLLLNRFLYIFN